MPERGDRWFVIAIIFGLVIVTTLPYLFAARYAGENHVFGGFLLNPMDGNTYLSKMYQGWRGDLRFTLPFTAEVGNGSFFNIFYLLLGHLARVLGISLLFTFHAVRVIAIVFLLFVLYRFLAVYSPNKRIQRMAFIMAAFGAGLGWLALPFGEFTSDFWVAEAYPFLSAYANPHFPLGLGLLLLLLTLEDRRYLAVINPRFFTEGAPVAFTALLLAIVYPFGVVIALIVLSSYAIFEHYQSISELRYSHMARRILWIALGGVPILIYYLFVIRKDTLLSIWYAQNKTPTPPIWDFVISFSPVLIMAILAVVYILRKRFNQSRLLITWTVLGIVLLYIPWGLQRRFIMGLYVPLGTLAALWFVDTLWGRRRYYILVILLIVAIIPTNIIILMAARHGMQTHDPILYLTSDEARAFEWIEENTNSNALILSSPETGLFIPAHTGRRVLYGHPYETVNARQQEALVRRFYQGNLKSGDENSLKGVDYIFEGPRERQLGSMPQNLELQVAYKNQNVLIYRTVW